MALRFAALALLATHALAYSGVDLSQPQGQDAFSCLSGQGFGFAVVRCYTEVGSPDDNCPQSIRDAWNGGMNYVDVYFYPDMSSDNPSDQASSMVSFLASNGIAVNGGAPNAYGMVWLDIEGWADWSSDQDYNRNFFLSLASTLQSNGQVVGVYTSASQWGPIMDNGWTGGSQFPLWYAHYDGDAGFDDFSSFGGWDNPSIKQYQGGTGICGGNFDLNWYPDSFRSWRNQTLSERERDPKNFRQKPYLA